MQKSYSLYEAKTRFSEIIRQVRERGVAITISYHGRPVAEIRPLSEADPDPVAERVRLLEERGEVVRGVGRTAFRPVGTRHGALDRFLRGRD